MVWLDGQELGKKHDWKIGDKEIFGKRYVDRPL